MKNKQNKKTELNINRQNYLVNSILNNVYQIFNLLQPFIKRIIELKDSKIIDKVDNLNKAAVLFEEISKLCKEIENSNSVKDSNKINDSTSYFT